MVLMADIDDLGGCKDGSPGSNKDNLEEFFRPDLRMQDEFFRRRAISISDLDGSRVLLTPLQSSDSDWRTHCSDPAREDKHIDCEVCVSGSNFTTLADDNQQNVTKSDQNTVLDDAISFLSSTTESTSSETTYEVQSEAGSGIRIPNTHSYALPQSLRKWLEPSPESEQVLYGDAASLPVNVHNGQTPRALLPSVRAKVLRLPDIRLNTKAKPGTNDAMEKPSQITTSGYQRPPNLHDYTIQGNDSKVFKMGIIGRMTDDCLDDRKQPRFDLSDSCEKIDQVAKNRSSVEDPQLHDFFTNEEYRCSSSLVNDLKDFIEFTPNMLAIEADSIRESMSSTSTVLIKPLLRNCTDSQTNLTSAESPLLPDPLRARTPLLQHARGPHPRGIPYIDPAPFPTSSIAVKRRSPARKAAKLESAIRLEKRKASKMSSSSAPVIKRARLVLSADFDQVPSLSVRGASRSPDEQSRSSSNRSISLPCTARDFSGRFNMCMPEAWSHLPNSAAQYTFGEQTHPNGQITNTCFNLDGRGHVTSFDEGDMQPDLPLALVVRHAEQVLAYREDDSRKPNSWLRTEAHRECAFARLEGVSVGYFRYFAGHLTVEEYLASGMCVCWRPCFCNKLCTRYGDMICPCTRNLVMKE